MSTLRRRSPVRDGRSSHPSACEMRPPSGGEPANLRRRRTAKPSGPTSSLLSSIQITEGFPIARYHPAGLVFAQAVHEACGERRPLSSRPTSLQASLSERARELRKKGRLRIPRYFIDGASSCGAAEAGGKAATEGTLHILMGVTRALPIAVFPVSRLACCRSCALIQVNRLCRHSEFF